MSPLRFKDTHLVEHITLVMVSVLRNS